MRKHIGLMLAKWTKKARKAKTTDDRDKSKIKKVSKREIMERVENERQL